MCVSSHEQSPDLATLQWKLIHNYAGIFPKTLVSILECTMVFTDSFPVRALSLIFNHIQESLRIPICSDSYVFH